MSSAAPLALRASTRRPFAGDQLTELDVLTHHHQRLRGIVEDAEQIALVVAGVDILTIDEQGHGPAAFDRLIQPRLEPALQNLQQLADARHREPLAAQVGKHHQLEQLDRRVAALGETTRLGLV